MIFDLIINKDFDNLKKYIIDNINIDFDIHDEQYNYIIQYLVLYNLVDIIAYLFKHTNIRLDILDTDGRSLLFIPIKYNYITLLKLLIDYDQSNIGLEIINMRDTMGYTGLHYSIIFNNFKSFKKLYEIGADINIIDNMKNNIFTFALQYNRTNILLYLLEKELNKTYNINQYLNSKNESVFQSALLYDNTVILNYIINHKKLMNIIINNTENEHGLSALHQSIILNKNEYGLNIIEMGGDIHIVDFLGNTPLHYALIEKNFSFIESIIKKKVNIINSLNIANLNGDTPLHLFLDNDDINITINDKDKHQYDYLNILEIFLHDTNINLMNNTGVTPLHIIVNKNLWTINSIKNILINGNIHMNLFIVTKNKQSVLDLVQNTYKTDFINMAVDSYYNIIQKIKEKKETSKLVINWEKYCATDDINNIMILYKNDFKKNNISTEISYYCKEYIKKMITDMKRSIPQYHEITLNIDSGVFIDGCYYTGSTIDILFGLVYLYKEFNNLNVLAEYPLTENKELEKYYTIMGINYNYKFIFSNIEIIWAFQKIIYITYFDSKFKNIIKKSLEQDKMFVIIPLGIEVSNGAHANIIIIDIIKKTIERFEPNGKNSPNGLYYNPELLDNILENKFLILLPNYTYFKPHNFLPVIGFQMLETIEENKCKKIGDPNGFCAIWCVWWVEQRVSNSQIKISNLANKLINQIRLSNKSFKNLIRNYSIKIVQIRDRSLLKYKLNINDWILNNYTLEDMNNIEKDVLAIFDS
jgi:ankyrin repeat protein